MKKWVDLTNAGKLRRVSSLAASAMDLYDIEVARMHLYCFATNPLYEVHTTGGERFILRMAYPGWRTLKDLEAEAMWLDALDRDTDIGAPRVVHSDNGLAVLPMKDEGIPETWNATLMTWISGRLLVHYLNSSNLEKMGRLFAQLHVHGKSWKPPEGFSTRLFCHFISRGESDSLFDEDTTENFVRDDLEAFIRIRDRVEAEYANLDKEDIRVIHCDLWHENIKLDHGKLRPFDFEDTVWGFRLHDIAMGMLDLLETVGNDRYSELLAAFRHGYEEILDWPEGNMEVLQLGRLLWKANWTARFAKDYLGSRIEKYSNLFRRFEETGCIHLED